MIPHKVLSFCRPRFMLPFRVLARLFFVLLLVSCARASVPSTTVTFTWSGSVPAGRSVFVVGDHPVLGAWDVTHAVKLHAAGSVWSAKIAIPLGTTVQYKFISRLLDENYWCDPANSLDLTTVKTTSTPAITDNGRTVYFFTSRSNPQLAYWQNGSGNTVLMTLIGAGRTPGESLFGVGAVGSTKSALEFAFTDGTNWDRPAAGGNYITDLDTVYVADSDAFSYKPATTLSAPRIMTSTITSTVASIPSRDIHVYLPRGYDENTDRRYPVVYFHDGQNVFDPGGPNGSWSADAAATREMARGAMREAILVAIDNSSNRIPEYMPPSDSYLEVVGIGDAMANFVINNVKAFVDTNYRTLTDATNTGSVGSSMGGLFSLYLGREYSGFGKIAVMSPSLWSSPNLVARIKNEGARALRAHFDMGTIEGEPYFGDCVAMCDTHVGQGEIVSADVEFVAGCGQAHTESSWQARLPETLDFLFPARDETSTSGGYVLPSPTPLPIPSPTPSPTPPATPTPTPAQLIAPTPRPTATPKPKKPKKPKPTPTINPHPIMAPTPVPRVTLSPIDL